MNDCLFCKIISGEIPSNKIYEDEYVYSFYDISPQAPVHFLVIPKEHISSANDITAENSVLVSKCFEAIAKITAELGIDKNGYRVVNNCGEDGQQTVKHLHFHVLGGRGLQWPPG